MYEISAYESEVGAYEAKAHLSWLSERARQGERIVITRHGTPVAHGPPVAVQQTDVDALFDAFARLRAGTSPGPDLTLKDLAEEGRR